MARASESDEDNDKVIILNHKVNERCLDWIYVTCGATDKKVNTLSNKFEKFNCLSKPQKADPKL